MSKSRSEKKNQKKNEQQEYIVLQTKIFIRWVNQRLAVRSMKVDDLKGFASGFELVALLEILSESKCSKKLKKKVKMRPQKLDNVNTALAFVRQCGVKQRGVKVSAENVLDGTPKEMLGFLWAIMKQYMVIENDDEEEKDLTVAQSLKLWFKNQTSSYKEIEVHDLTKSFHNGLILCAIIHKHRPDLIDYDSLDPAEGVKNIGIALEAANKWFELDSFLLASDIPKLDKKCMIVFLSEIYYGISAQVKIAMACQRIGKLIRFTKENDEMREQYKEKALNLKGFLDQLSEKMSDRTIDNTMEGAKTRLEAFYVYKKDEKGNTVDSNYLTLESLLNLLLTRLTGNQRPPFTPEQGTTLNCFRQSKAVLEENESKMKLHLHSELNRQIKLAEINSQHGKEADTLTSWCNTKSDELQKKQDIQSVGAADYQLRQLVTFRTEKDNLLTSNYATLKKMGGELRKEKFQHSDQVTAREKTIDDLMPKLDTLGEKRQKIAEDDLSREEFKEMVLGWDTKHVTVHKLIHDWIVDTKAYLDSSEEVNSISEAELQLSLLQSRIIERKDLEQIKVPPLQELGKQILEAKYDKGMSTWMFGDAENLKNREKSISSAFPELDELAASKLKIREDDVERESFREHLRQQNQIHIDMFNNLKQWIDKKKGYLNTKEDCKSVLDASDNLAVLVSYQREKNNQTNGAVPALKKLGKRIRDAKYEKLSNYVFPSPEEIDEREKKVNEAWVELDQLYQKKKEILDDDILRETFKAKLSRDNEQHKMKFQNFQKWIEEKSQYLNSKDECVSLSQAQINMQTFLAYGQEKFEKTKGDVSWIKNLGKTIITSEYKSDLSKYVFENPEILKEREREIDEGLMTLEAIAGQKLNILEDDIKRETFKEKLRQQNEQHKAKFDTINKWIEEKKQYLGKNEEVSSCSVAQSNLSTHHAYEEEKKIMMSGSIGGWKAFGKTIRESKYNGISTASFATPEEIIKREGTIDSHIKMLDEMSAKKEKVLRDDYAREEFKEQKSNENKQHISDYEAIIEWASGKKAYLNKKDEVGSIPDAQQNLSSYAAYLVEKENTTNGAVSGMKELGNKIIEGEYKSDLSTWKWKAVEEIRGRENKIDEDWKHLEELAVGKKTILDDDLSRETFKEQLRLKCENHKSKYEWIVEWYDKSAESLGSSWSGGSISAVKMNLQKLEAFNADLVDVSNFNVASLLTLGKNICEEKYESPHSSYIYDNRNEIKQREDDIATKFKNLKDLSAAKKKTLDLDLAHENSKEDLRLRFANCAADFRRWTNSRTDQIVSRFGFTLQEITEFSKKMEESDNNMIAESERRQAEYKKILLEGDKLGVKDNQYTTETSETLSDLSSKLQDTIEKRHTDYKEALNVAQTNDQKCKDFASLITEYFDGIEKVKEQLGQSGNLEEQLSLIDSKIIDEDPILVPIKKLEEQMTGIKNNVHTVLTYLDAKLFFESFQKFLVAKKKNIEDEIFAKKMKGISQEQYDEIESQFKKFDSSGNGILEKKEFKACLFTLGDDRGSKEIKQIIQKYSTKPSQGMSYEGFKLFMIDQLGDSGTKMDMLYSFAMINGNINPNEKKKETDSEQKELEEKLDEMEKVVSEDQLVKVMTVEHDREYLKANAPVLENGIDFGQWIDDVFAR